MATFEKRGKKWRAGVVRQGVRKSKTFDTKAQAQRWAADIEREIMDAVAAGRPMPTQTATITTTTVGQLIDRYCEEIKPMKPWGKTKDALLAVLAREFRRLPLTDLTTQVIVQYALRRRNEGRRDSTVEQELVFLGQALKVARSVFGLPVPPQIFEDARVTLRTLGWQPKAKEAGRNLTEAEIAAVKLAWRSGIPASVIDFALATSMRLGEIVRVRWEDYDPVARTLVIRDRKHPSMKEGNDCVIPLLNGANDILQTLPRTSEVIWPFKEGSIGAAWQRAAKRAGVSGRFHDLRHSGISRLFAQGYQIHEVAVVSGHRDWKQLKRYTHVAATDLHRDLDLRAV